MTTISTSVGFLSRITGDRLRLAAKAFSLAQSSTPVLLVVLYTRVSDLPWLNELPASATQAVVALFAAPVALRLAILGRSGLVWDRTLGWMLIYGAAIGLSMAGAVDRLATAAASVAYLRDLLIAILVVQLVVGGTGLRRATWSLVAAGASLAAVAFVHVFTGFDFLGLASIETSFISAGEFLGFRLSGPLRDSNQFAQMLVPVVPLALYRAWDEPRRTLRLAALALLALVCLVIILTFSRSGFLALLTIIALALVMQRFRPARVLPLALMFVPVLLLTPFSYWDRLTGTLPLGPVGAIGDPGNELVPRILPRLATDTPMPQLATATSTLRPSSATPTPPPISEIPTLPLAVQPAGAEASQAVARPTRTPRPRVTPVPTATPRATATPGTTATPTPTATPLPPGDMFSFSRGEPSVERRLRIWRLGVQMFSEHPFTGVGRGNYLAAYPDYTWMDPRLPSTPMGAHNSPTQIAAETGLIGLAAFLGTVAVAVVGVRGAKRRLRGAAREHEALLLESVEVAIYGYLTTSLFLNDNYTRLLWLLVALSIVGRQLSPRSEPRAATVTPNRVALT